MVAEHAGFKFTRCPATYIGAQEARIVASARAEFLDGLTPRERQRLPAKLHQALEYTKFLCALQKAEAAT